MFPADCDGLNMKLDCLLDILVLESEGAQKVHCTCHAFRTIQATSSGEELFTKCSCFRAIAGPEGCPGCAREEPRPFWAGFQPQNEERFVKAMPSLYYMAPLQPRAPQQSRQLDKPGRLRIHHPVEHGSEIRLFLIEFVERFFCANTLSRTSDRETPIGMAQP